MYEIKSLQADEGLTITKLAQLISRETEASVAFLDIVSVEKKTNKTYKVKWFGCNKDILKKYHKLITDYFNLGDSKSLLFLANKNKEDSINGISSKHLYFKIRDTDCSCNVNYDYCLSDDFSFNDAETTISVENEKSQIQNWHDKILSNLCITSATFSKIEFTISGRNFVAAIWVGYNKNINDVFLNEYSILIQYLENFLWSYSSNSIASELITETERQATKSAISQVMARNSSHNIGSHVMNRLTGDLSQIDLLSFNKYRPYTFKELYKEKFDKLNHLDSEAKKTALTALTALKTELLLDQLAIFNNYVKCRMDYLSDITFGTPLMQTTKKVNGELFKELDKVRLLLEYISGLSKFRYEIRFTEGNENNPIDENSNLSLALPNDILGCQALYNIIENVIRNTAKHSTGKEDLAYANGIIFTLNIKEINVPMNGDIAFKNDEDRSFEYLKVDCAEHYQVEIFDNVPVKGDKTFENDEDRRLEYLKDVFGKDATKPISNIDYLVYSQNKKLNESILQDNNSLRASALGLIEMEASACYLRKLDISNIESDDYNIDYNETIYNKTSRKLNIVKAFKAGKEKNNLGYRFFMLRPAEVLVVSDLTISNASGWLKKGVKIINVKAFKTSLEEGKVYNHQFLVYEKHLILDSNDKSEEKIIDAIKVQLAEYKTSLPLRIVIIKDVKPLFNGDLMAMEEILWTEWEIQYKEGTNIFTYIRNYPVPARANEMPFVLFNHVGEDETEERKKEIKGFFEEETNRYLEALSSKAQAILPNFNTLSKGGRKPFDNYLQKLVPITLESKKIVESCFSKIVVIDERVQSSALDKTYMGVPFNQLYKKSNIIIPEYDRETKNGIDLAAPSYDAELIEKVKAYIECQVKNKCYFVIIHYSILERMFAKSKQEKFIAINNYLNYLDSLSAKVNVIITSGRGTPQQLTNSVRYVNLSPILSALVEVRSKYLINSLLHSSRKSNTI